MAYLQLMITLGVGLLGLAYFMYARPRLEGPQTNPNSNSNNSNNNKTGRRRKSRPGDKCPICLSPLTTFDMRILICEHAMHNDCYDECRTTRVTCPTCGAKYAELSEAGDNCSVCIQTMSAADMEYMLCEHAMHKNCLSKYRELGNTVCPLCRRKI